MKSRKGFPILILAALLSGNGCGSDFPYAVSPQKIELAYPPAPGSEAEAADRAVVADWNARRTVRQCEVAQSQHVHGLPLLFFGGGDLAPPGLYAPMAAFLRRIVDVANNSAGELQKKFNRPRPLIRFPELDPCVAEPNSASYPSAHATTGALLALVLTDVFPDCAAAFRPLGRSIGDNRVIAGVHFPTDIDAGEAVAEQLLAQLRNDPRYLQDLELARRLARTGATLNDCR